MFRAPDCRRSINIWLYSSSGSSQEICLWIFSDITKLYLNQDKNSIEAATDSLFYHLKVVIKVFKWLSFFFLNHVEASVDVYDDLSSYRELKAGLSYRWQISRANTHTGLFLLLYCLNRQRCNLLNACKQHVNGPECPSNALFKGPFWRAAPCHRMLIH